MSRAQRLLDLIQLLRRRRRPVSGSVLADELGVSLRTLYRDIATLNGQGARIDGEAGVGFLLRPGFLLPPLMFSDEEIEALVLGTRWVAEGGDRPLAQAARNALAKISAVLPDDLKDAADNSGLLIGPMASVDGDGHLETIRKAIRAEKILTLAYTDAGGAATSRSVWPIALGFFERARIMVAWCEFRTGFRHFRLDRITGLELLDTRYPRRRRALLKAWRETEKIAPDEN